MADKAKPFTVRTTDGVFVKGYNTREEADTSAEERNVRAQEMGLNTRYEGTDQPSPAA